MATVTTSAGDVLYQRSRRQGSGIHEFPSAFWKFTAPDIAGGTITAATFNVNSLGDFGVSGGALTVEGVYVKKDLIWDASTSGTDLGLLSVGTSLDTTSLNGTGWKSINITGDGSKGMIAEYSSGNPLTITIKLIDTDVGTGGNANSTMALGEDDAGPYIEFDSITNLPYLEITYTPASS